jgi:hypothetical protein
MRCRARDTGCRGRRPGDMKSELGSDTENQSRSFKLKQINKFSFLRMLTKIKTIKFSDIKLAQWLCFADKTLTED